MKVTMRYFGIISELTGKQEEELHIAEESVHALLLRLEKDYQGLEGLQYAVALDQELIKSDTSLDGVTEIAILPPFAGG